MASSDDAFAPAPDFSDFWIPPYQDGLGDLSWLGTPSGSLTGLTTSPVATIDSPAQASEQAEQQQRLSNSVPLLYSSEWDATKTYDERPPQCIHYLLHWKLAVKGTHRCNTSETHDDCVLAPSELWKQSLLPTIEKFLRKRLQLNTSYRPDDVKVTVSVNERGTPKVTKRFDDLEIEWSGIERKLQEWSGLFLAGKRLRIELVMNFIEVQQSSGSAGRSKRKRTTTSNRMHQERSSALGEHDEEEPDIAEVWHKMYKLFRCSCKRARHCLREGSKHFPLSAPMMTLIVEYAESGESLTSHDDVPQYIREQVYAEAEQEQARRDSRKKPADLTTGGGQPIHINVHPAATPAALNLPSDMPTPSFTPSEEIAQPCPRIRIPGKRDQAVVEYCRWHISQDGREHIQAEYRKARDITLKDGLDLQRIHELQNVDFFINHSVKSGEKGVMEHVAQRWVCDIPEWAVSQSRQSSMSPGSP